MKINFLGTGTSQGIPVIGCDCIVCSSKNIKDKRLRSSVFIQHKGLSFLIDTGPDLRQQVLKNNIKNIDFILYTYAHRDHVSGIDELRSFNFIQKKTIPAFGNKELSEQLINDYSYIFSDLKYPGLPKINLSIVNKKFNFKGLNINPIKVLHYKLNILGYRIGDFTYITDAKTISDNELKKISGSKILVINCLQIEEHISHLNLNEALKIVKKLDVKEVYFTHISHYLGLHDILNKDLPSNVNLAHDSLLLEL